MESEEHATRNGSPNPINFDDMLARVRTFYSNWCYGNVSASKLRVLESSDEHKSLVIELLGKFVKAHGVEILSHRKDDLSEFFNKLSAVRVILSDARFQLANDSFNKLLDK